MEDIFISQKVRLVRTPAKNDLMYLRRVSNSTGRSQFQGGESESMRTSFTAVRKHMLEYMVIFLNILEIYSE